MEYCSVQEKSQEWNMSKRRIQVLCKEGRITGAKIVGNMWLLPLDMEKPYDARKKSPVHPAIKLESGKSRQNLKILLKNMYAFLEEKKIEKEVQRSYVLAALAAVLINISFAESVGREKGLKKYFITVLKELTPSAVFDERCMDLLNLSGEYMNDRYSAGELDNIISWAYQYSNKIQINNAYSNTQFFTEEYMVKFLLNNIDEVKTAEKIVDPCCGGGNFLVHCVEVASETLDPENYETQLLKAAEKIYGYDIDSNIVRVAAINIKLKIISLLAKHKEASDFSIWRRINLNLYVSSSDNHYGTLVYGKREFMVSSLSNGKLFRIEDAIGFADVVVTNPPFETIKGMDKSLKLFLKQHYPLANCDVCVAFLYSIYEILNSSGICGIVTQNSWMFLKSFGGMRKDFLANYQIKKILNLGSGAFRDLSGEKTSVALMIIQKTNQKATENTLAYADLSTLSIAEKIQQIKNYNCIAKVFEQSELKKVSGGFDFISTDEIKNICQKSHTYAEIATPMQGTSTGNAKELIDFFWNHFGDSDWKLVSKGGGYCRWQGLNNCVVKWGSDGGYIKNQKGSALRNVKYFKDTSLVFSDTGTAGLNVRTILEQQIFVASGPGIRVHTGNAYAQLAFLNSRIATYFIRVLSPKLTIAAGYIGLLPIAERIYNSAILERNAELCIELKKRFLCKRPNNLEYINELPGSYRGSLEDFAWEMFICDLKNELLKLEIEYQSDLYISDAFKLEESALKQLDDKVGVCAYAITNREQIAYKKLDIYMDKLLDHACDLKRSRSAQMSIGSDGMLEYTAKELSANPEYLVREITDNKKHFINVVNKYKNLIIHNEILNAMGYTTTLGMRDKKKGIEEAALYLSEKFIDPIDWGEWILKTFEILHGAIFKNAPILTIEKNKLTVR